jgi:flagellar biosynthetic protein FliR
MGLSMSQMYDPASNANMPLSGNFYNITLVLLFFLTNSHGNLLQIIMLSFEISPVNSLSFNPDIGIYLMRMFGEIMTMSLKFAFPVIAAELITETGVGIVMRAVPQINVFVVGLQLKILAGLTIMIVCAPISVWFFDDLLKQMGESALEAIIILTS